MISIRLKLALVLTFGIAAAAAVSSFVFLSLNQATLQRGEEERMQLITGSVSNMASESLLARDPLMLLDYLQFLKRDRPEIHRFRVQSGGRWKDIPAGAPAEPPGGALVRRVEVPGGKDQEGLSVEAHFSRAALARWREANRRRLLSDLGWSTAAVALGGLLVCFPLGWSLTRRLVDIEAALRRIGEGGLGVHVPVSGSDEIARVAEGVNAMSDRLEEVDRLKKTFVASVTHELRSPLGAIDAYVKELLSDPSRWSSSELGSLQRISGNTARLSHFVTNLLDMAKIERGKLDYAPRDADLGALVADTVLFFKPKASESGIELASEVESGLPPVSLDPDLISHVLTNLLSNALKFSRKGTAVQVTLKRTEGGFVECAVADHGVGLKPEDLGRVFTPFERVKNPLRSTGTGLGLTISKSIIELHGGVIGAVSEHGRGSRFHFRLPMK